VDFSQTMKWLT